MPTRRDVLQQGLASLLAGPTLLSLASCQAAVRPAGRFDEEGVVLASSPEGGEAAVRAALAPLDLSWLSAGDSVFVKLACNSPFVHPATTAPSAVRGVVAALYDAGAGRVIVGDQAGVEHVRLAEGEQRFGATRDLTRRNGLLQAITDSGAEAHFFDEADYDGGYFEGTPPADTYWTEPIWLPNIVREVDHIVNLPRIASHSLAGYTHGLKNAMGWLRDDSRFHVHHKAGFFHEKYVDINHCAELLDRVRLTLSVAESLLLHGGPDRGTIVPLDAVLAVASSHLGNHDAVTAAILASYTAIHTSSGDGTQYNASASLVNYGFLNYVPVETGIPWGRGLVGYEGFTPHRFERGLSRDRALRRTYGLGLGIPEAVPVQLQGTGHDPRLLDDLAGYSSELLRLDGA